MVPGCTMGRKQSGGGRVMLWAMFCWETLGPAIHVDVTLTRTTYLSIVADRVHTFMETVFPDYCDLFQQDNALCHKAKNGSGMVWGTQKQVSGDDLASKFLRSQSNRASLKCAGQTSLIHGGPTSQLTGLKGSAANILVPDTTAHLQGSSGVHASTGQLCFGSMGDHHNIRQVVIMLCLIGVWFLFTEILLSFSIVPAP